METRLEYLEGLLGDSADKHAKELATAKDRVGSLEAAIKKCAKTDHATSIEGRVGYLEKCLGESADKHDAHKVNMEGRLEYIENLIGDNADKHWKEIEAAKAKLGSSHEAIKSCARAEQLGDVERALTRQSADIDDAKQKLREAQAKLDQQTRNHESHRSTTEGHAKELEAAKQRGEDAKQKLRDQQAKLDQHAGLFESHRLTTDQRLEYIEALMADASGQKMGDFTKDLEKRLFYMQEDQKRARDVLESSLQEQLRLEHSYLEETTRQMKEHWERELKARMAYQDQYKDMIVQERTGREGTEQQLEHRMQHLERCLSMETNRLWVAIDKHTHEGLKEVVIPSPPPVPPPVTTSVVEVLPPQTIVEVLPAVPAGEMIQSPRVPMYNVIQAPPLVPGTTMSPPLGNRVSLGAQRFGSGTSLVAPASLTPPSLSGIPDNVREARGVQRDVSSRVTIGNTRYQERAVGGPAPRGAAGSM